MVKHILIATPLYPPDIGGPAQYAKNLETVWRNQGHQVVVAYFGLVRRWPAGIRHLIYFFSLLPKVTAADFVLALDTWSVGLPAVLASRLLGKKIIIRTGGDFLWEQYVERTDRPVLLREFYQTESSHFSFKEQLIFKLTKWTLRRASLVVFSTDWQRRIWQRPYGLELGRTAIVENYYGPKRPSDAAVGKVFLVAGRDIKLKNYSVLKHIKVNFEIGQWPQEKLKEKLRTCYAVVVPSLSEISPNLVLEALGYNKPFVLTQENGLMNRLESLGVFIDPLDPKDIAEKIGWLNNEVNYAQIKKRVEAFTLTHSWEEMAQEFVDLAKKLCR